MTAGDAVEAQLILSLAQSSVEGKDRLGGPPKVEKKICDALATSLQALKPSSQGGTYTADIHDIVTGISTLLEYDLRGINLIPMQLRMFQT